MDHTLQHQYEECKSSTERLWWRWQSCRNLLKQFGTPTKLEPKKLLVCSLYWQMRSRFQGHRVVTCVWCGTQTLKMKNLRCGCMPFRFGKVWDVWPHTKWWFHPHSLHWAQSFWLKPLLRFKSKVAKWKWERLQMYKLHWDGPLANKPCNVGGSIQMNNLSQIGASEIPCILKVTGLVSGWFCFTRTSSKRIEAQKCIEMFGNVIFYIAEWTGWDFMVPSNC